MSMNDEHNLNLARIKAESRLVTATDLLERIVSSINDRPVGDTSWWRDFFLFTGQHMILTNEGWESGESRQSYIDMATKDGYGIADLILDEVNAPNV